MEQKNRTLNINEKVLSVIKAAFIENAEFPDMDGGDIKAIEMIAKKQSILSVVIYGIKKQKHDELLTESMKQFETRAIYDYVQRSNSLERIAEALARSEIPYIPLKGAFLRSFYPQPYMRSSSDIDILVHETDLKKAIDALVSHTDFQYCSREHHDVHFLSTRVHLELHFSLLTNLERIDQVLKRAWDYSFPDKEQMKYQFSSEFQLFYNVAHSAKHFIKQGGIGIRPLIDLWLLRTQTEYDEQQIRMLCSEAGLVGFYEACCNLLAVWFENAPYTEMTRTLEDLVMSGGVFGSEHNRIVSLKRNNKQVGYLRSRIFKSRRELNEDYPMSNKYPILLPVYQVARWTHLFRRNKRKKAIGEWKHSRCLNQTEIEQYDWLLKSMGL